MASLLAAGVLVLALGGPESPVAREPEQSPAAVQARGPKPKYDGIFMLGGAGVANVVGLTLNFVYHRNAVTECGLECIESVYFVTAEYAIAGAVANLAAAGLAAGGGAFLRQHDNWERGGSGVPQRVARPVMITGAVLTALGIAGTVAWWGVRTGVPYDCPTGDDCPLEVFTAHVIGVQVSAHVLSAGTGMLAYGVSPEARRKKHSFHLFPMLGHNLGLSFGGRF